MKLIDIGFIGAVVDGVTYHAQNIVPLEIANRLLSRKWDNAAFYPFAPQNG